MGSLERVRKFSFTVSYYYYYYYYIYFNFYLTWPLYRNNRIHIAIFIPLPSRRTVILYVYEVSGMVIHMLYHTLNLL